MLVRHIKMLAVTLLLVAVAAVPAAAQTTEPPQRLFLPAVLRQFPSPYTLTATADAFVFEAGPNVNTGSEPMLIAGNDQSEEGPLGIMRSFVRFDLPPLQSVNVQKAVLRLFYAGYGDFPNTSRWIYVREVQVPWSESTITWANHLAQAGDLTAFQINSNQPFGYVEVEVTDVVRAWLTGHGNYGLMIFGPEDAGSDWAYRVFASRESQYPPQLVLTLN